MPLYEYRCSRCGVFETIQRFSDAPLEVCPQCEAKGVSNPVSRIMSKSAFHLKGGGWYKDGYSSSSSSSGTVSGGADSAPSGGTADAGAAPAATSSSVSSSSEGGSSSGGSCGSGCGCH